MSLERLASIDLSVAHALLAGRCEEALKQSHGYSLSGAWRASADWTVDGDLELPRAPYGGGLLVVEGNLTVTGFFRDTWSSGPPSFVVVLGDLHARDMSTADFVFVSGDLVVDGTLYGNSASHTGLFVQGKVEADVLVLDGHSVECKSIGARVGIDTTTKAKFLEAPFRYGIDTMSGVVDQTLIGKDECLEPDRVENALRAGRSILTGA